METVRVTVYSGEYLALDSFGAFEPDAGEGESEGVRALIASFRNGPEARLGVQSLEIDAGSFDAVLSGAIEVANYHDDYAEGRAGAGPSAARMGRQDRDAMTRLADRVIARARKAGLVREPARRAAR